MGIRWFGRGVLAAAGAFSLALTACGGTSSAPPPSTKTASTQHGTVIDGLFEEPNHLNPILGPGMTFAEIVEGALFRNLINVTPTGKMLPDLATTVPTLANGDISKNGLVYTFHIRKNANWTNGKPVTSQDVITTWKLIVNPKVVALSTTGWSDIKSIKALSSKSFQVTLKNPFGPFLEDAFSDSGTPGILPNSVFGKYLKNPSGVNKASFNHDPTVSDGPFMFKKWVAGASITVVANPHWYGTKPKAKSIVFKVIPSQNTLLANAQAHSINVYYFAPITQATQLQAISGAKVHFTTDPAWESAVVNMRNPILKHLRVREALEMAIDRSKLVSKVWKGHGTVLAADQPPISPAYNKNLKPWPYDPTKAKQLLGQVLKPLGYSFTGGYWQKGGKPLTFVYATTAGNTWREASERLDQYWLKQVGVNLKIHNYPANAYFGSVLPSGKGWDLGEYEDSQGLDPTGVFVTDRECGAPGNFGKWCDPKLDHLISKAMTAVTPSGLTSDLQQAEVIMNQQLPHLWYYSPSGISVSINMSGYQPNPFVVDTWNVWDWAVTK